MPSIDEKMFLETNEKYGDGVAINVYNNEISIVAAKKTEGGEIYMEWGYPQKRQDGKNVPGQKGIPWKISLGVKEDAVHKLERLLNIVERVGKSAPPAPTGTPQPQEFGPSPSGGDQDYIVF